DERVEDVAGEGLLGEKSAIIVERRIARQKLDGEECRAGLERRDDRPIERKHRIEDDRGDEDRKSDLPGDPLEAHRSSPEALTFTRPAEITIAVRMAMMRKSEVAAAEPSPAS